MFQQTCRTFAFDTRSPRSIGAIRSVRVNLGRNTGTKPNYKINPSVFFCFPPLLATMRILKSVFLLWNDLIKPLCWTCSAVYWVRGGPKNVWEGPYMPIDFFWNWGTTPALHSTPFPSYHQGHIPPTTNHQPTRSTLASRADPNQNPITWLLQRFSRPIQNLLAQPTFCRLVQRCSVGALAGSLVSA